MFQIEDFEKSARSLGIGLMFSLKNIVASTSLGSRDDRSGAMTSFTPSTTHSNSS